MSGVYDINPSMEEEGEEYKEGDAAMKPRTR